MSCSVALIADLPSLLLTWCRQPIHQANTGDHAAQAASPDEAKFAGTRFDMMSRARLRLQMKHAAIGARDLVAAFASTTRAGSASSIPFQCGRAIAARALVGTSIAAAAISAGKWNGASNVARPRAHDRYWISFETLASNCWKSRLALSSRLALAGSCTARLSATTCGALPARSTL
jgi:hypothetical protein